MGGTRRPSHQGRRAPKFGQLLALLRGDRSRQAIVNRLAAVGVQIHESTLARYEDEGRPPDLIVLTGLAKVFLVARDSLVDALVADLTGQPVATALSASPDHPRHIDVINGNSASAAGGSRDDSSTRLLLEATERELDAAAAMLEEVGIVTGRVLARLKGRASGDDET